MANAILVYGSYGYTGALIIRMAVERGLKPVLAGRNQERLAAQAEEHGLEYRCFALDNEAEADKGLADMTAVLHCAGPFVYTAKAMAAACLRTGTHYVDITGEIVVFELLARMDQTAKEKGVMLLPGGGFDVVPTDCLAAHLKEKLPSATHLALGFISPGRPSHGTRKTIIENMSGKGAARIGGKIVEVPAAWKTRDIDFDGQHRTCVTIPWGDVSTAFYSTGIPNIEVYVSAPQKAMRGLRMTRYIGGILAMPPVRRFLQSRVPAGGPSDEARAKSYCKLWGEAKDESGQSVEARLHTPDGYTLTALTALRIAERILEGDAPPGFRTPSLAYGADLILEVAGIERT